MPDNRSFYPKVTVPMSPEMRARQKLGHDGPCARCHRTCRRYGPMGAPFCSTCSKRDQLSAPPKNHVTNP